MGTEYEREDIARRQRILGVVLGFFLVILGVIVLISVYNYYTTVSNSQVAPPLILAGIFLLFLELWVLNRKGYTKVASYAFLGIYFLAMLYAGRFWGATMPIGLLSYALFITMAGIIVSSRFGLVASLASVVALVVLGIRESASGVLPAWKMENVRAVDIAAYGAMIVLAAFFSWLSTKELDKLLKRARASEAELKIERDNLEIAVDLRTKELKQAETERSVELARFAEFGKLSAGVFHDIVNPLTAISLSLKEIGAAESPARQLEIREKIESAIGAARRMEASVARARKNIRNDDRVREFEGGEELKDVVEVLRYRARENYVELRLVAPSEFFLFGDPLKFYQACLNIILNAVESYGPAGAVRSGRLVDIRCLQKDGRVEIIVSDKGAGMDAEAQKRIFDPFFTTKESGIGLGLPIAKDIIEQHFRGSISCSSTPGQGTTFVISLPLRKTAA